MTGFISWDDETGFWIVTDEYGDVWRCIEVDGTQAMLEREDNERFHGAEWSAYAGGSNRGDIYPRREGDTYTGANGEEYEFSEASGWQDAELWIDEAIEEMEEPGQRPPI